MIKYVKVRNTYNGLNLDYGWCLKLDSVEDLLAYHIETDTERVRKAFMGYNPERVYHNTDELATVAEFCGRLNNKGDSFIDSLSKLLQEVHYNQHKAIGKFGCIYIQNCGSYMPKTEDYIEYSEIVLRKKTVPPKYSEEDIRIIRFPNGCHYYPKIGNVDVVINGVVKWNTSVKAKEKAIEFLSIL